MNSLPSLHELSQRIRAAPTHRSSLQGNPIPESERTALIQKIRMRDSESNILTHQSEVHVPNTPSQVERKPPPNTYVFSNLSSGYINESIDLSAEDEPEEINRVQTHMDGGTHKTVVLPTQKTKREQWLKNKYNSLSYHKYVILFLVDQINSLCHDITLQVVLTQQRWDQGIREPLPFNIVAFYVGSNPQLTQIIKELDHVRQRSGQSREKFVLLNTIMYKLAEQLGFKLILGTHTNRKPTDRQGSQQLNGCKIGIITYQKQEIENQGIRIYNQLVINYLNR